MSLLPDGSVNFSDTKKRGPLGGPVGIADVWMWVLFLGEPLAGKAKTQQAAAQ